MNGLPQRRVCFADASARHALEGVRSICPRLNHRRRIAPLPSTIPARCCWLLARTQLAWAAHCRGPHQVEGNRHCMCGANIDLCWDHHHHCEAAHRVDVEPPPLLEG